MLHPDDELAESEHALNQARNAFADMGDWIRAQDGWLRACVRCKKWSFYTDLYCEACWEMFYTSISARGCFLVQRKPFPVYSLVIWKGHSFVGDLIYALKKGGLPQANKRLAECFLRQRVRFPLNNSGPLLPSPAVKAGDRDHAYQFAHALAELLALPLENHLVRITENRQKAKSLIERKKVMMKKINSCRSLKSAIFVDDVVTSGSTARAAFKALGRPKQFEVWSLAYRSKVVE